MFILVRIVVQSLLLLVEHEPAPLPTALGVEFAEVALQNVVIVNGVCSLSAAGLFVTTADAAKETGRRG